MKPSATASITPTRVREFREAAVANGYPLIRVRSLGKAPVSAGWQNGEPSELLFEVTPGAENTGMICSDFVVVDIDCDDPTIVSKITETIGECLPPGALTRRRAGSPRAAVIFRADGKSKKRSVFGEAGKVEFLADGQQVVVDGIHPSGNWYCWESDLNVPRRP